MRGVWQRAVKNDQINWPQPSTAQPSIDLWRSVLIGDNALHVEARASVNQAGLLSSGQRLEEKRSPSTLIMKMH